MNYNSQEEAIKELDGYDLIIDCTGSNEMLHFLSYAASNMEIISMCITNHANDLLCISSKDGNPFEQRKTYLSRIEQDTKNFYVEGKVVIHQLSWQIVAISPLWSIWHLEI